MVISRLTAVQQTVSSTMNKICIAVCLVSTAACQYPSRNYLPPIYEPNGGHSRYTNGQYTNGESDTLRNHGNQYRNSNERDYNRNQHFGNDHSHNGNEIEPNRNIDYTDTSTGGQFVNNEQPSGRYNNFNKNGNFGGSEVGQNFGARAYENSPRTYFGHAHGTDHELANERYPGERSSVNGLRDQLAFNDGYSHGNAHTYNANDESVSNERNSNGQRPFSNDNNGRSNTYRRPIQENSDYSNNNYYQSTDQLRPTSTSDNTLDSGPAKYEFKYDVYAPEYSVEFGHEEQRDGASTVGAYYVLLPDGRRQLVEYTADEEGFKPKISYTDEGQRGNTDTSNQRGRYADQGVNPVSGEAQDDRYFAGDQKYRNRGESNSYPSPQSGPY